MEVMTAGASREEERSGTYCPKGVRARVTLTLCTLGSHTSWELNTLKVVTGSSLQATPGAALRDRASPFPPGGHSPPLLEAEKEQVCEGERRLLLDHCLCS